MNRTEYKNQHAKEHYDRINFKIPIGEKERIKEAASAIGMSVNEYLYALVYDDLASGESKFAKKKQGMKTLGGVLWVSQYISINGIQYEICPNTDRFLGPPSKYRNYRLSDVVDVGDTIAYEYDFGSTTELMLLCMKTHRLQVCGFFDTANVVYFI